MRRLIYTALTIVLTISVFAIHSEADPGDLFVQVENNPPNEGPQQCSILKVTPFGSLSEFVSNGEILIVTGENGADCDDAGIACALNGDVYFSEDFDNEGKILRVTPEGDLSLFVPNSAIAAVTGGDGDLDDGLVFGPDGNLYANGSSGDNILRITVPGGDVSIAVTETQITAATGLPNASLEGGIGIDEDFNIFITDGESNSVVSCQPGGPCTVLTTAAQIQAVTGFAPELNEPAVLDTFFYVADDGPCGCVIRIDTNTGIPELFVSSAQITGATGNLVANPEGGLALDAQERLYIGDDGDDEEPNILRSNPNGTFVSVFVSETEIRNFYAPIAPGFDPELDGSMCIQMAAVSGIPTLSEWGMLAMAAVLGILGLAFAMRRRALKA